LGQRIDKWLFFARVFKSRSLAQAAISSGHVRVNGDPMRQPSRQLAPGDRLDIKLERRDMNLVVKAMGERRGPYPEARLLYEDLTPPAEARLNMLEQAQRIPGSGRPTKKERRALDAFQDEARESGN
jgi:ribosome-associated heat shock protein Hsp15